MTKTMTNATQGLREKSTWENATGVTCKIGEPREVFIINSAGFHEAAEKSAHRVQWVSNPALKIGYWGDAFMG